MENLFEEASREKLRFKLTNGIVTVEDLWDQNLQCLDKLAKALNKEIKESEEESFIKEKTRANKTLDLKFAIVKHIIATKLSEAEKAKLQSEKMARKNQILELIGRKEIQSLEGKSIEELQKELAQL